MTRNSNSRWTLLGFALRALALLAIVAGCRPPEIDTTYGKRRGTPGALSVNGTAVLAGMFEKAGHRVSSWPRLSPKIREAQTIVWFPNRFLSPTTEQREFLMLWLREKPGRTLVYVGRDFEASIGYWRRIRPVAPPEQHAEIVRREAIAISNHDKLRDKMPLREENSWYTLRTDQPSRAVQQLAGPWSEGVVAERVEIELGARLEPPPTASQEASNLVAEYGSSSIDALESERLLTAGDDTLVTRLGFQESGDQESGDGQILIVANGSFLLNLPLVNHEHRKLAGRLIDACGSPGRVVFLESGPDGPEVLDKEPGANAPTGFEVFTVWPIGVILLHLTALGILACITLYPIPGRPRELPPAAAADFGQHVTAVGELLEISGDREYAWSRWRQYQEQIKNEPTKTRPAGR